MSYTNPTDGYKITATSPSDSSYSVSASAVDPNTFGVYDIAALQYLYGANTDTTTPTTLTLTDSYQSIQTLWAPKEIAIDASATTRSNVFDLRGGAYSSVAVRSKTDAIADLKAQLIASGRPELVAATWAAKIWAAKSNVSTATGKTAAVLNSSLYYTGKNDLGLAYGSKMNSVKGGLVSDIFYASNYSSTLDGGDGSDVVYLAGVAADWKVGDAALSATPKTGPGTLNYGSATSLTLTNSKTNAVLTVTQIEKYAFFNDVKLSTLHA